jgi:PAS domain S-box-containing protein
MHHGQAFVIEDRCILCGNCILVCPQHAKKYRRDIDKARQLIASGRKVVVSVAPSYIAAFEKWEASRLPSALRSLGFQHIGVTSLGAYEVAQGTADVVNKDRTGTHICTACPVVVNCVEKYHADYIPLLVDSVSPMVAHAKMLKQRFGEESAVVFVGPCIAKKGEAERSEVNGLVEAVLTFEELAEWMEEAGIELKRCEESAFDESPVPVSTLFPLIGGLIKTADMPLDAHSIEAITVSGSSEIEDAFSYIADGRPLVVEGLYCQQGCINGPGVTSRKSLLERKLDIINYSAQVTPPAELQRKLSASDLHTTFGPRPVLTEEPIAEDKIREVLRKTGKEAEADMLNCGACGYATCREKAIAVLHGYAELEMCIPYVRKMAQQRTDKIIETSPNGIVILNEQLEILTMNPAFCKFFCCNEALIGKRIANLMDPEPFEKLAIGRDEMSEAIINHQKYNFVAHQKMYKLRDDTDEMKTQIVGIFVDISKSMTDKNKLDSLRAKTLMQAQDLLDHQINMAQELAKFLGESTARGEELVENLFKLTEDEEKTNRAQKENWVWKTYSSK